MFDPTKIICDSIAKNVPQFALSEPVSLKASEVMICALTGTPIPVGSGYVKFEPSQKSFTDWQYLSGDSIGKSVPVTESAAKLVTSDFLKFQASISAAVYAQDEARLLTTDAQRVDFFLDPPKAPFVAYVATTMGQHAAWKAPVTLDSDFIKVGFARKHLTIDRLKLLKAIELSAQVMSDYLAHDSENSKKKSATSNSVFLFLDRNMEEPNHGLLKPAVKTFLQERGDIETISFFETLSEGELWALSPFLKAKTEVATRLSIAEKLASKANKGA